MPSLPEGPAASRKVSIRGKPAHGRDLDLSVKVMSDYETARTRDHIA